MDTDPFSSAQRSPLPLVKTTSMEWFGEALRPDLQVALCILLGLTLLTMALLILVSTELRSLTLDGQAQTTSAAGSNETNLSANATSCMPPIDWALYPIQPDDSLSELSRRTGVSITMLANSNCLQTSNLESGNLLYLPAVPSG